MGLRRILWAVVIIAGLAWAGVVGIHRVKAERAYHTVELIVDLDDARVLSAGSLDARQAGNPGAWSEVSADELLARFRTAGVTGVALREITLEDLTERGWLKVENGIISPGEGRSSHPQGDAIVFREMLIGRGLIPSTSGVWGVLHDPDSVLKAGLGLDPAAVALVRRAHLTPVPRYSNTPPLDAKAIDWLCQDAQKAGARLMIFDGDQVLGYPGLIKQSAGCLRSHGMAYGSVEFAKQRGDAALGEALKGRIVRVHSITGPEMAFTPREEAIERFVRAVRERNIRACYLRLFLAPEPDAVAYNVDYVKRLADRLRANGYAVGQAQPFPEVHAAAAGAARAGGIALVVVAFLATLLIALIIRRPPWPGYWTTLAVLLFVAMIAVSTRPGLMRSLFPLGIALVFPTLALLGINRWLRPTEGAPAGTGRSIGRALIALLIASAISWLGGLLLASVLTDTLYMTAVRRFAGTKLALVLPIVAVAAVYVADAFARDDWRQQKQYMAERVRAFFTAEWRVWHTLVAIAALAALAIALMRSGNESLVGIAGFEMKLRGLLEHVLYARPRFKEFAIGHPALMLAGALAAQRRPRWVIPFLLVGAVGQVSIVNTYEHLHTPLLLSLLRTFNGIWIGAAIGVIVILIFARPGRRSPSEGGGV
jgi:hypothetical protein